MSPKKRRAAVKPKRRHPGRAYPKPKGKVTPKGKYTKPGSEVSRRHRGWEYGDPKPKIPTTQRPYGPTK